MRREAFKMGEIVMTCVGRYVVYVLKSSGTTKEAEVLVIGV